MPRVDAAFSLRVPGVPAGTTLLPFLIRRFPYLDGEAWRSRLEDGSVTLEGLPARSDAPLKQGLVLRYVMRGYEEPDTDTRWFLLSEQQGIRFVHKPPRLPVHKTGRVLVNTLVNLHREAAGGAAWSPLNRLDAETSGIVAFALGAEAFREAAPNSPTARWCKLYVAWVRGRPPAETGTVALPLREKPGDAIRCRMHPDTEGKPSRTEYRLLFHGEREALIAFRPVTGRKHQLRAHAAALGCPIVGDKIYAQEGRFYLDRLDRDLGPADYAELGAEHHLLHAFYLRIRREGAAADCGAEDYRLPEAFGREGRTAEGWAEWLQGPEPRLRWETLIADA